MSFVVRAVALAVVIAAGAPLAAWADDSSTIPVSGPPLTTPVGSGGGGPFGSLAVSPTSGPVGTVVRVRGACAHVTDPSEVLGGLMATSDGFVSSPVQFNQMPASSPPGTSGFAGQFTIPDTLYFSLRGGEGTPRPTAPGLHRVWATCFSFGPAGETLWTPVEQLPMAYFCVTPSLACDGFSHLFAGGWFSAPLFIDQIAIQFTPKALPPPPPDETTTTTQPRRTTPTNPPPTNPPPTNPPPTNPPPCSPDPLHPGKTIPCP